MSMSEALRRAIAHGEYQVDARAVALAILDRARAMRTARRLSEVLEAAERLDVRCAKAGEEQTLPMEDVA
jgi:hypothetical protein